MLFTGVDKGTDPLLDNAFPARLRLRRGRLAFWDVFVRPTQQPHRPECATAADQQHRHPLFLDDPSALPIEQRALQALPPAFVPPAASIRDKPFLGGRQARYHKPCDRTKAVARQFVATHIRSALVSLSDAHVWEEASVVRLECQLLEHLPAAARFDQRVAGCPKDVLPVQLVQAL
jgi:hypothetical protein